MEITLDTKIDTLLKEYPFLEEELIKINPRYKKLKNPILRNTIAKLATIKAAAKVGGMEPYELLNKIRKAVGQEPIQPKEESKNATKTTPPPSWIEKVSKELDADKLLDEDKNPLAEVNRALREIDKGEVILLKSSFEPEPLIQEMQRRGLKVYTTYDKEFKVYIQK